MSRIGIPAPTVASKRSRRPERCTAASSGEYFLEPASGFLLASTRSKPWPGAACSRSPVSSAVTSTTTGRDHRVVGDVGQGGVGIGLHAAEVGDEGAAILAPRQLEEARAGEPPRVEDVAGPVEQPHHLDPGVAVARGEGGQRAPDMPEAEQHHVGAQVLRALPAADLRELERGVDPARGLRQL